MPLRHRGGRCWGVILQTPSGAVLAALIVNPGDAIIVIPTGPPNTARRLTTMASKYQTTIVIPHGRRRCFQVSVERTGRQPLVARFGGIPLRRQ